MKPIFLMLVLCAPLGAADAPVLPMTSAPPHHRVIDKKFLALSAAEIVADGLDIFTSVRARESNPAVFEINPLLGRQPSAARMVATQLPFTVAANVIAWRMRKSVRFHRVWEIPFVLSLAGSAWGVNSNLQHTGRPPCSGLSCSAPSAASSVWFVRPASK